jgi:hypothetical protein
MGAGLLAAGVASLFVSCWIALGGGALRAPADREDGWSRLSAYALRFAAPLRHATSGLARALARVFAPLRRLGSTHAAERAAELPEMLDIVALGLAAGLVVFLILRLTRNPAEAAPDPLWDGSWYADELGRIDDDEALVKGMETFERKTGVRPYLTLLDGVAPDALNDFVEEQYEALFGSADHLLVVYDEWGDDTYFLLGRTGRGSAMTEADVAAVLSCLEAAYADPAYRSYAEAFGAGFAQGAEETSVRGNFGGIGLLLALGILLAVLSVVLILFLRKRARDAARRDWEDS